MTNDNLKTAEINRSALAYNRSISPALKKIVAPLFKIFGFNHFSYLRQMPGDRYLSLIIDSNYYERYFELEVDRYLLFPEVTIPNNTKRTVIWDLQKPNGLLELLRFHNYCHGISIFIRQDNVLDSWHFATDKDNSEINAFYTNQLAFLEQFILYFQEKAPDIFDPADQSTWAMYKNGHLVDFCPDSRETNYSTFKNVIQPSRFPFQVNGKTVFLSPTEFKCLKSIATGHTAKSTSKQMSLSPRTVEAHLTNVKEKLQLSFKSDLAQAYQHSLCALLNEI